MINDSAGITGPSVVPAIIGNPSPASHGTMQLVSSAQANFAGGIWQATKNFFNVLSVSNATVSLTKAASGATSEVGHSIGQAVTKTGDAVKSVATSASSGIKWGFFGVVLIVGLVLFAQLRKAV